MPKHPVQQRSGRTKCIRKRTHNLPEHLLKRMIQPLNPIERVEIVDREVRKTPRIKSLSEHDSVDEDHAKVQKARSHTGQSARNNRFTYMPARLLKIRRWLNQDVAFSASWTAIKREAENVKAGNAAAASLVLKTAAAASEVQNDAVGFKATQQRVKIIHFRETLAL